MSEPRREDKIRDGQQAERILNDPVFQRAVEQTEEKYVREWKTSEDPAERERLHARVNGLQDIVQQLHRIVNGATWERHEQAK